jgi:2,3-bisphosphoglycerate-dependent phosphoglycerate mutase
MTRSKGILILLRHGASAWNEKNLFTGWVDIPLSSKGVDESLEAGKAIAHLPIDLIFTSTLIRAQMTATLAMLHHSSGLIPCLLHPDNQQMEEWGTIHSDKVDVIPMRAAWQLNERMYGELQGMNKDEMRQKFGADKVHQWRRSFDGVPPGGESLKMTSERTVPYFEEEIVPFLEKGKNVLVAAHGNSLRSIVMKLDHLSPQQVVDLEVPTGKPWIYTWKEGSWSRNA